MSNATCLKRHIQKKKNPESYIKALQPDYQETFFWSRVRHSKKSRQKNQVNPMKSASGFLH